ncbi:hypothetical protein CXP47_16305 [Pseudomonas chlororaphis]|nr:hypothetical protein CXP47_16305 [Pseudomonas chlororaphis]
MSVWERRRHKKRFAWDPTAPLYEGMGRAGVKGIRLLVLLQREVVARYLMPVGRREISGAATDTPKAKITLGRCARAGILSMFNLT